MRWIISEMFYPDEVSTAFIMTEIAEKYAVSGEVGVICGPKGYEKVHTQQKKDLNPNIEIYRVSLSDFDKNKILSRIFRIFLLTFKMTIKALIKVKRGDEVLIVTNPAFLLITMAFFKPIKKFKFNILVHDVFPENLIPTGLIKEKSLKFRLLNKIFNWAYKRADNLIVLGDDMGNLLMKKLKKDNPNIQVIPNWSDPTIYPLQDFSASEYFGIDLRQKVVIGFAGNIGRLQALPEFVNCFIKASNPILALVIIGDGAFKNELEQLISHKNIKNVFLLGSKPRSEQNHFLNSCDIGLVTLSTGMRGLGVPSKSYNIMAAGKPILFVGDEYSEVDSYISKFNIGWSFSWEKEHLLTDFLKELTFDNPEIKVKGEQSLNTVNKFYSKDNILELFNNLKK